MARRVVSVLRGPAGLPRASEPTLEANAYAVAEDVELTIVLRGRACELATAGVDAGAEPLAGVDLPVGDPGRDLRGLLESGIDVYVEHGCVTGHGLEPADLVDGIQVVDAEMVADLLRAADAVVRW